MRGLKTIELRKCKVDLILKLLSEHDLKILNLQETRLSDQSQIPIEFKHFLHIYNLIFCGASEHDQGSGILIFVKKTEKVLEQNILFSGRLIHLKIQNIVTNNLTNFFSFYGKSNVNKAYAESILGKLHNQIENESLENIIICGDFNFVTSLNDRNTNNFTQTDNMYKGTWNNIQVKFNLLDTFRKLNPKRRLYTFHQTNGISMSRIDRIYISADLAGRLQKISFENTKESDHKLVRLIFGKNVEIGSGTWIFNNTLLNDTIFTDEVRQIIVSYTSNNIFPNKKIAWDFLKMDIKNYAIKYAKAKAQSERKYISIIRNKLEILESLDTNKITQYIQNEMQRLRQLVFEFNDKKIKGHKIRSKLPYFEEGEGDISYFAKLEKRKGEENLIFSLEDSNGTNQEGTENLKTTIFEYYEKLYKKEYENEDNQN